MANEYNQLLERLGNTTLAPELLERLDRIGRTSTDPLTGLLDCRSFSYQLQQALPKHEGYSVIAAGIDHIQEINLISSWVVGDLAICSYGSFIEQNPPPDSFTGRTSGCTFMTFIPSRDRDTIRAWLKAANKFVRELDLPGIDMLPDGHLTLSAGIYLNPSKPVAPDFCMIEARKRLDYARDQGGNQASLLAGDGVSVDHKEAESLSLQVSSNGEPPQAAEPSEITLHGLTFNCAAPFLVRQQLTVRLGFANGDSMQTESEVVWRRAKTDATAQFELGVRYNDLSPDDRAKLEDFMIGGE